VIATASNVYGTAHTTVGDLISADPIEMHLDSNILTLYFPFGIAKEDYAILTFTVHLGNVKSEHPLTHGPVVAKRGDRITVIQRVEWNEIK
jgi:hypothetical protein